jgi:excisionase family DNA binding protein
MAIRITPKAAAAMFGISAATICRWAREGRITAERTQTGRLKVDPAEIARMLGRGD